MLLLVKNELIHMYIYVTYVTINKPVCIKTTSGRIPTKLLRLAFRCQE